MERREFLRKGLLFGAGLLPGVGLTADVLGSPTVLPMEPMGCAICESTCIVFSKEIFIVIYYDHWTMKFPIITAKGDASLVRSMWKTADEFYKTVSECGIVLFWQEQYHRLAEHLYESTQIGHCIPTDMETLKSVAEVMAMAYRAKGIKIA